MNLPGRISMLDTYFSIPPWLHNRMLGNQAIATTIGLVPLVGDIGIAVFKTNFRNAALLEEYLRVRGEEFLKAQADRVEDPTVVKPGAGKEEAEKIPGKWPSQTRLGFFRRSSKKVPVVDDPPTQDESKQTKPRESSKSNGGASNKGKGKDKERDQ